MPSSVENLRGVATQKDKRLASLNFMRASAVWKRSLPGILSYRGPASQVLARDLRQGSVVRPLTRSFYIKTDPRPQLEDFFSRVQWPTTKAEEKELVESVANAIWDGHDGGILQDSSRIVDLGG